MLDLLFLSSVFFFFRILFFSFFLSPPLSTLFPKFCFWQWWTRLFQNNVKVFEVRIYGDFIQKIRESQSLVCVIAFSLEIFAYMRTVAEKMRIWAKLLIVSKDWRKIGVLSHAGKRRCINLNWDQKGTHFMSKEG